MFLSKSAIIKQLFYEFLEHETLALAPGKPSEIISGTLLASSSNEALITKMKSALNHIKYDIGKENPDLEADLVHDFHSLCNDLYAYKHAANDANNPFLKYANLDETKAHPCAWLMFAPMVIFPTQGKDLNYETEADFIEEIKHSLAMDFEIPKDIKNTGLFIAVNTNNHEMVDAFLCPDFHHYRLNKDDLKTLLSLTDDPQTRMALFRHSDELLTWIKEDEDLQKSCVKRFEELKRLWLDRLNEQEKKEFIQYTNVELWLNLLDEGLDKKETQKESKPKLMDRELCKQKIVHLLGHDFALVNENLCQADFKVSQPLPQDETMEQRARLNKTLHYLNHEQQFDYLIGKPTELDALYPLPREQGALDNLLSSLGYHHKGPKLTVLRYIVPVEVENVHNKLISALIDLNVDTHVVIEALNKIEQYVNNPNTKNDYKAFLNKVGQDAVNKEYETGFFLMNWINQILRFLGFTNETPLHPYINQLSEIIKEEIKGFPGEFIDILPPQEDFSCYQSALSAYSLGTISLFWQRLPEQARELIVTEPLRFQALLTLISNNKPADVEELISGLDAQTLSYFNTPKGLQQLVLETPSFDITKHLPLLIGAMKGAGIIFLKNKDDIVTLLRDSDEKVFNQIVPYFPSKSNNDGDVAFQKELIIGLQYDLKARDVERFLKVYTTGAAHYSTLLSLLHNTHKELAEQFWKLVKPLIWFDGVAHANDWSGALEHLEFSDRIKFFDKLVSRDSLDAKEFCALLTDKEAIINQLWNKIPQAQWDTWIKDNELPRTTKSFLDTVPPSFKIAFFNDMLLHKPDVGMYPFCVTPDKTIEQFYPQEVKDVMNKAALIREDRSQVAFINDVKAKLDTLINKKRTLLNESLDALIKAVDDLKSKLNNTSQEQIKKEAVPSFFFNPWGKPRLEHLIKKSDDCILDSFDRIGCDPFFHEVRNESNIIERLTRLDVAMNEVMNQIEELRYLEQPSDLTKAYSQIELTLSIVQEQFKFESVINTSRLGLGS